MSPCPLEGPKAILSVSEFIGELQGEKEVLTFTALLHTGTQVIFLPCYVGNGVFRCN